jgi:hypothetical protein
MRSTELLDHLYEGSNQCLLQNNKETDFESKDPRKVEKEKGQVKKVGLHPTFLTRPFSLLKIYFENGKV